MVRQVTLHHPDDLSAAVSPSGRSEIAMHLQVPSGVPDEAPRRAKRALSDLRLPLHFLSDLVQNGTSVTFRRGEPLFPRNSTADLIYWVASGVVKVYYSAPRGSAVLLKVAGPGDFIGFVEHMGAKDRRVQAFEAHAMTNAAVAIFTRDRVRSLLKTLSAENLVALVENINAAWSAVCCSWIGFLGLSFRERLRSTFEDLAERFGARESRGILLTLELSHDDLAQMIACSRPMVTRLVAEFARAEFITRQGRHYIVLEPGQDSRRVASRG
jgi:CRP-like cAMP-binding protein